MPSLKDDALDLLVRILSFWCSDVRMRRGSSLSANLWSPPIVNLLNDRGRTGAARALFGEFSDQGSKELNLMPILGPGRSFFSLQVIKKGDSSARMHSHTSVDEYYLILEGKGTLRFNGKKISVGPGDLISKPTGPDAATHLNADRGGPLRILDMEVWNDRYRGNGAPTKDLIYWPDFDEAMLRGPGWEAGLPTRALFSTKDIEDHWSDAYRRAKDGHRVSRIRPTGRPGR
ncbi:MAG: cupin domain-containing protein [Euryarchaeota archaeon]|nr:cupin domain-containing protein [Euryarchaeota archaeon]MDE1879655.1 cupin domain-containing protein [Euryarchaeota archaeon]MDE2045181.1 cupin domain-containing protein [Thermoplasmata archaeon]